MPRSIDARAPFVNTSVVRAPSPWQNRAMRRSSLIALAFATVAVAACGESRGTPATPAPAPAALDASTDANAVNDDASVIDGGLADGAAADAALSCGDTFVDDFENAWTSVLQWDGTFDVRTGSTAPARGGHTSALGVRVTTAHYDDAAGLYKNVATSTCPVKVQAMIHIVSGGNNDNLVVLALDLADGRSLDVKLVRGAIAKGTLVLSDQQTEASSENALPTKSWRKVILDYVPTTGKAQVMVGDEVWANVEIAPSPVTKVRIGVIRYSNTSEGAEANDILFDDVAIQM